MLMEPRHPQNAIWKKCFHPSASFIEFKQEALEQSVPDRFEAIVRRYPNQRAAKMGGLTLTYDQLNRAANIIAHAILKESASILWKEVLTCYTGLSRGIEPDWQSAPPLSDYIAWLQQQEQRNTEAETFWRGLLEGFIVPKPQGVAAVSRDARDKSETHRRVQVQLSRDQTGKLQAFARQHRVTMNTLAQAAWALVLSRHSGDSDVLFGAALSVRPSAIPGIESMVGPLINVLPVRVRLVPEDPALTFLQKLHRQQVEMSQYDYSSLAKVQEWSGVPRGMAPV